MYEVFGHNVECATVTQGKIGCGTKKFIATMCNELPILLLFEVIALETMTTSAAIKAEKLQSFCYWS